MLLFIDFVYEKKESSEQNYDPLVTGGGKVHVPHITHKSLQFLRND